MDENIEELEVELWHEKALRGAWQEAAKRVMTRPVGLQHCTACGVLTDRGECDCTRDGRPPSFTHYNLTDFRETLAAHRATAIEQCALLAEEMHNHYGDAIAKAIRALKNENIREQKRDVSDNVPKNSA